MDPGSERFGAGKSCAKTLLPQTPSRPGFHRAQTHYGGCQGLLLGDSCSGLQIGRPDTGWRGGIRKSGGADALD
jgi:hypothetical protein